MPDGNPVSPLLVRSDVDSARFGLNVYRGTLVALDEWGLLEQLLTHSVDVAIVRIPWEEAGQLSRLDRVGLPYLVADSLVYYAADLQRHAAHTLRNPDLEFVQCTVSETPRLEALVEAIFTSYKNHYAANPLFSAEMLPGYKEWACSYATDDTGHKRAWVVRRGGRDVGFATCAFRGESSEGILYGVIPEAAGGGVYGDIIRFTQQFSRQVGCSQMEVSTQTHNYAVQRVWAREGFVPVRSYVTLHINSLLQRSALPRQVVRLRVRSEDFERMGSTSGDRNRPESSGESTAALAFEGSVAHGQLVLEAIWKHYGTVTPGPGTTFLGSSFRLIRPMYLERDYSLEFSFPVVDIRTGVHRAVARVFDQQAQLCLLSYSDLTSGAESGAPRR